MKFSKPGQLALVSTIGLVVATLLTACQIVTIDYVFVADSSGSGTGTAGQIQAFAVDSESGAIRTIAPAVPSGGVGPIAIATTADYANLYVLNQGNNSVVHFNLATSGVLSSKDNVTLATVPVALAVNPNGNGLYVVSGSSSATLTAYALSSGTIGSPVTIPLTLANAGFPNDTVIPTGVTVMASGAAVYVTAYDQTAYNPGGPPVTSSANPGWVFGFTVGTGGALTPVPGSPFKAGVKPSALVVEPTNRFVYVTDFASNQLIGYSIQSSYNLNFLINGPFKTGFEPSSIAIDPRGKFLYVSNQLDSSVSAYVIDLTTGTPTGAVNPTGSSTNSTDTEPVAIAVDPALGRYVYTANKLGNSLTGFRLDPTSGALTVNTANPYPTGSAPTALAIVPHGNHATQAINP